VTCGMTVAPSSDRNRSEHAQDLPDQFSGGVVEVESGRIAEQPPASDKVKQFGSRMVQDLQVR